jgi:hypothetical protein
MALTMALSLLQINKLFCEKPEFKARGWIDFKPYRCILVGSALKHALVHRGIRQMCGKELQRPS